MKMWLMIVLFFPIHIYSQVRWDAGGDGVSWSDMLNWSGDVLPSAVDDVLLDNTFVAAGYSVNIPGAVIIKSLVVAPTGSNIISVIIPTTNTADPGLTINGIGEALVLRSGAVFRNASGAATGSGLAVVNTFRIDNGSRYIHNTSRASAGIVSRLSVAPGTELGIVEFDVPGAVYSLSLSGRTYGTLILSAATHGSTVTYIGNGSNALNVRGNLEINPGVNFSIGFNAPFNIDQHLKTAIGSIFNLQSSVNNNSINVRGNIDVNGVITETNSGQPRIVLNGNAQQEVNVLGSITNTIDFHLDNPEGAKLNTSLQLPLRLIIDKGNFFLRENNLIVPEVVYYNPFVDPAHNHIVTDGNGKLVLANVHDKIFPVGFDGMHYNPVHLTNGLGATFNVRVREGAIPSLGIPFPAVLKPMWIIECNVTPSAAVQLRLGFDQNDIVAGFNINQQLHLGKYIGQAWTSVLTGLMADSSGTHPRYEVAVTGMNSAYDGGFIIGNAGFGLEAANFLFVNAHRRSNEVAIEWKVSDSAAISWFELQRSEDGRRFQTVQSIGSNGQQASHRVVDTLVDVGSGRLYYRILAIMRDGDTTVSAVRLINTTGILTTMKDHLANAYVSLRPVYPNPAGKLVNIDLEVSLNADFVLLITDMKGRLVRRSVVRLTKGNHFISLDTEGFAAGVYLLAVYVKNERPLVRRFLKL